MGLENANRSIYEPSQPRHTLVLERIPATSAPTLQKAKRSHVWLFGQLKPLMEMLSGGINDLDAKLAVATAPPLLGVDPRCSAGFEKNDEIIIDGFFS